MFSYSVEINLREHIIALISKNKIQTFLRNICENRSKFTYISDPAKPLSINNFETTETSIILKGSDPPHVEAESGPINFYKVTSVNGTSPSTELAAAFNSDLEIPDLIPATLYEVQIANIVNSTIACGSMESNEYATVSACTGKILILKKF